MSRDLPNRQAQHPGSAGTDQTEPQDAPEHDDRGVLGVQVNEGRGRGHGEQENPDDDAREVCWEQDYRGDQESSEDGNYRQEGDEGEGLAVGGFDGVLRCCGCGLVVLVVSG